MSEKQITCHSLLITHTCPGGQCQGHSSLITKEIIMSRRILFVITLLFVTAIIVACGRSGDSATAGDSATKLAQTAEAILTATAAGHVTPEPTQPQPTQPPVQPTLPAVNPTVPPPPCTNSSKFLADVTIPDDTHLAPNTPFDKTWRLINDGTCTWETSYQFRLIDGEAMGGATINLPKAVPAGDTIDISIKLVAPATAGKYTGRWRLFAADGSAFGQRPYVRIIVP